MHAAPRWTAAATSRVVPALRSNAAAGSTQLTAVARNQRGMAVDKQNTDASAGFVSPWKTKGAAVKRGMPKLPEAGMLIRRAEILLVREPGRDVNMLGFRHHLGWPGGDCWLSRDFRSVADLGTRRRKNV